MSADLATLRERLLQLDRLHDEGAIGDDAWREARAAVEREVVAAVVATPAPAAAPPAATDARSAAPAHRPSRAAWFAVSSFTVVLAVVGYLVTGSPSVPSAGAPGTVAEPAPAAPDEKQFAEAVGQLAARLAQQPDDPEGWAMLARAYGMLGRFDDALPAYARAVALRGDDARLLTDYADTLALTRDRNLEGEPLALVQRALAIDPQNLKALSLAGAAAFNRADWAQAVEYWERVVRLAPPDSPYLSQVRASIAEARTRGGIAVAPAAVPDAARVATAPAAASAVTGGSAAASAAVGGTVTLAPSLAARAAPDDTVFIYARPAEGSRMPLAIVRHRVRDLPVAFRLDDSMAMSPAARLSQHERVTVTARISRSGDAAPRAGDLVGETAPVARGRTDLRLEIDTVVER